MHNIWNICSSSIQTPCILCFENWSLSRLAIQKNQWLKKEKKKLECVRWFCLVVIWFAC